MDAIQRSNFIHSVKFFKRMGCWNPNFYSRIFYLIQFCAKRAIGLVVLLVCTDGICQDKTDWLRIPTFGSLIEEENENWFQPQESEEKEWYQLTTLAEHSGSRASISIKPTNQKFHGGGWWLGKLHSNDKVIALLINQNQVGKSNVKWQGYTKWINHHSTMYIGNLALRLAGGTQFQNYAMYRTQTVYTSAIAGKLNPTQADLYGIVYQFQMKSVHSSMGMAELSNKQHYQRIQWLQSKITIFDQHIIDATLLTTSKKKEISKSQFHSVSATYSKSNHNSTSYLIPVWTQSGSIIRVGTTVNTFGRLQLDGFGKVKHPNLDFANSRMKMYKYGVFVNYSFQLQDEYQFCLDQNVDKNNRNLMNLAVSKLSKSSNHQYRWKGLYAKESDQWRCAISLSSQVDHSPFNYYRVAQLHHLEKNQKRLIHTIFTHAVYSRITYSWSILGWTSAVLGNTSNLVPNQIVLFPLLQSDRNPYLSETGGYFGLGLYYRYQDWNLSVQIYHNVIKKWNENGTLGINILQNI